MQFTTKDAAKAIAFIRSELNQDTEAAREVRMSIDANLRLFAYEEYAKGKTKIDVPMMREIVKALAPPAEAGATITRATYLHGGIFLYQIKSDGEVDFIIIPSGLDELGDIVSYACATGEAVDNIIFNQLKLNKETV